MAHQITSYFYNCSKDWGNQSCFTFYAEFHRVWMAYGTLEACVLFIVFLASLMANTVILYGIIKYPPLRTVTNYFMLNVAIADLVLASTIPLVAVTRVMETWIFGDTACQSLAYLQLVCGSVLIWTLTVISIERYRYIVVSSLRPELTVCQTAIIVGIVWLISAGLFVPIVVYFQVVPFRMEDQPIQICTLVLPNHHTVRIAATIVALWAILVILTPAAILAYNYRKIFQKLREAQAKVYQPVGAPLEDCTNLTATGQLSNYTCGHSQLSMHNDPAPQSTSAEMLHFSNYWLSVNSNESQCQKSTLERSGQMAHHAEVKVNCHTVGGSQDGDRPMRYNAEFLRCRQKLRETQILLIFGVIVLLMWIPVLCMVFVLYIHSATNTANRIHSYNFVGLLMIAFTNSCINAILYLNTNRDFQRYLGKSMSAKPLAQTRGSISGEVPSRISNGDPMSSTNDTDKHTASCSICKMAQESRLASVSDSSLIDEDASDMEKV